MARPLNSPNKITSEAKELFQDILTNESEHITSAFIELRKESAFKYLQTILKLSALIVPRPTEATVKFQENNPFDNFSIKDVFCIKPSTKEIES